MSGIYCTGYSCSWQMVFNHEWYSKWSHLCVGCGRRFGVGLGRRQNKLFHLVCHTFCLSILYILEQCFGVIFISWFQMYHSLAVSVDLTFTGSFLITYIKALYSIHCVGTAYWPLLCKKMHLINSSLLLLWLVVVFILSLILFVLWYFLSWRNEWMFVL